MTSTGRSNSHSWSSGRPAGLHGEVVEGEEEGARDDAADGVVGVLRREDPAAVREVGVSRRDDPAAGFRRRLELRFRAGIL